MLDRPDDVDRGRVHRDPTAGVDAISSSETQEMQYLTDGRTKYIWFTRTDGDTLVSQAGQPPLVSPHATERLA